ncbi:MAG: SRPBCC family protein [Pirellulaceae bacterium]|nr:SRPBCC family protein [Pirellulaceae bacterium]
MMGRCFNSTVVNAPIDQVWIAVQNFHDMSWGEGVITSCEAVGDTPGNKVGAKRILNSSFHETLRSIDHDACELTYSIDDGPEPVSSESVQEYIGTIRLRPVTDSGQTFCQWETTYKSNDDDLVAAFCNPIYAALLEAMKAHFAR